MSIDVQLVSGGLDSELVHQKFPDAVKLFVDYGQPEVDFEHKAVKRLWPHSENLRVVANHINRQGVYYPARNLLLATLAVTYYGADRVIMGGMADDNCIDKTPEAFADMSRILSIQANRKVEVFSPFWEIEKSEAVHHYLVAGGDRVRLLDTFSCYSPKNRMACMGCPACFRWSVALRSNGIEVLIPSAGVIKEYLRNLHKYSEGRQWAILKTISAARPVICFDIDGTLTNETEGWDYANRTVRKEMVERLGAVWISSWLILYSSRREIDRAVTELWLERHNIPYHALLLNKPPYAVLFDDKACV